MCAAQRRPEGLVQCKVPRSNVPIQHPCWQDSKVHRSKVHRRKVPRSKVPIQPLADA